MGPLPCPNVALESAMGAGKKINRNFIKPQSEFLPILSFEVVCNS